MQSTDHLVWSATSDEVVVVVAVLLLLVLDTFMFRSVWRSTLQYAGRARLPRPSRRRNRSGLRRSPTAG